MAGVTCTNSPASVGPGTGSGVVTPVASVVSGTTGDYTITQTPGSYSVALATSAVAVSCPASVTYTGSALTPCTATVTGAGGLSAAVTIVYSNNVSVGTAQATATFAGDTNHSGSSSSKTFSIAAAPLTVTAGSYSGVYDGQAHTVSACVVSNNSSGITCSNSPSSVTDVSSSGPVTPVISGSTSNYTVTKTNGTVSITPLAVSLTAGSYSGVYDGSSHAPTACVSSYPAGVTCTDSPATVGPGVGSGAVNPSSPVIVTGVAADYAVTNHAGTYSITKAAATLTWATPAAITYGTALSSAQLNATANTAGTFAYVPASGVLPAGSQTLSVTFTPTDATDYSTAMKSVILTVNKATTTTTVSVTTTQTVTGTTATLNATVVPQISGTPTGTVTYMNGTTVLGSAAVGTAFTTSVPVGANSITATYSGDANFLTSTSAKTTVTGVAPTTIQLIVPVPYVLYPLPVAYTVIVPLKNFQLITGTVTIYDGTTAIATLPLLPGGIDVGLTMLGLSPGTHYLTAVYNGDSHYAPGVSPVVVVNIVKLF